MKKYLLLFLSCSLLSCAALNLGSSRKELDEGIDDLSSQITDTMTEPERTRQKVAVLPFLDLDGNISDFGKFLSDEVIDRLIIAKKFGVVERVFLLNKIKGVSLTVRELIATDSVKELEKLVDADTMVAGTYTILNKTVKIRARVMDVKSAGVIAVAKTEIALDENSMKMLEMKRKPTGRWSEASEEVKQAAYDKHLKAALANIQKASNTNSLMSSEHNTENLFYKSALAELEMATAIYPNDTRAKKMQQEIRKLLGFED